MLYRVKSTISSKGQITIPVKIRRALGLKPGTRVSFELTQAGALIKKRQPSHHPVDRAFGLLESPRSVDEMLDEMRGPRPEDGGP